jgi:group I intron endonuclease
LQTDIEDRFTPNFCSYSFYLGVSIIGGCVDRICCIYKIECLKNRKIYIGRTKDYNNRVSGHKSKLNKNINKNTYIQEDWNRYGEKSFAFNIIEICLKEDLDDREKYWIEYYDSCNRKIGYNIESGGFFSKNTELEIRKKLSNANQGRCCNGNKGKRKHIGVHQEGRMYVANITDLGKCLNLGHYEKEEDAIMAYDIYAYNIHGDNARTNNSISAIKNYIKEYGHPEKHKFGHKYMGVYPTRSGHWSAHYMEGGKKINFPHSFENEYDCAVYRDKLLFEKYGYDNTKAYLFNFDIEETKFLPIPNWHIRKY